MSIRTLFRSGIAATILATSIPLAARAATPTLVQNLSVGATGQLAGTSILPGTPSLSFYAELVGASGDISFDELTPGGWSTLGTAFTQSGGPVAYAFTDIVGAVSEGTHHYRARYDGSLFTDPSEELLDVEVAKGSTASVLSAPATIQANHPFDIVLSVQRTPSYLPVLGSATIRDATSDAVLATGSNDLSLHFDGLPAGTYSYVGVFDGDATYASSTGPPIVVSVTADTVDATGVGVSSTSIYPYHDGYRDTVSVRGSRLEPASVAIRIYGPTGHLVRSASIASGVGGYGFTWNGKSSTGASLAAGKYRVVQTLTDAKANHRVVTSYVTISTKRIYLHTTYVYRTASQSTKRTASWIGWQLTLPSAAMYKSLTLAVYGRSGAPPARFGAWDFRAPCGPTAAWGPGCVRRSASIGPSTAWYSLAISPTYERSGHYVRAFAFAGSYATGIIQKVRVKVVYGILK